MRLFPSIALAALLLPASVHAQGMPAGMPLVVDMQKVEIGTFADYAMTMGSMSLTQTSTVPMAFFSR